MQRAGHFSFEGANADMERNQLLRAIPKMDELLREPLLQVQEVPAPLLRETLRAVLETLRQDILEGRVPEELPSREALCREALERAAEEARPSLRPVINATGVVLHTNLGRACLSQRAAQAAYAVARGYSTLEYNVEEGCRGSRHSHAEALLCRITGAESAMVVNNNAAAVLLILSAMGKGGEVVASRGELVEIGGSFRIPDIMMQCGCVLREVGATNKTHLQDYEAAIGEGTRALLKVHTSNFRIVGFTESVPLEDMVALGRKYGLPVIQDLGSGSLVDLLPLGIHDEPAVQQSVRAGVDVISFSGDKLLGGPQAGIILGKRQYIEALKKHPLARAVRVDKMTLAALRETLCAYLEPEKALAEVPTLSMLAASEAALRARAETLALRLRKAGVACQTVETQEQVGGGSVPMQLLPGWAVQVETGALSVDGLEARMRRRALPVVGRIHRERYLLDVRTLREEEFDEIARAAAEALK